MARAVTWLDVFTDKPLTGNGLAVVHDADGVDDATMHAFARETRLSETTFVQTATEPGAAYRNRIWMPTGELPFAGHPSLGTAVAVARARGETAVRYVQQTGAGLQPIEVRLDARVGWASMGQEAPEFGAELDPELVMAAVGLPAEAADSDLPPQIVSTGLAHVMAPVREAGLLADCAPAAAALRELLAQTGTTVAYVVAVDPTAGRARARSFFPGVTGEVEEDPATGSAAGPLVAYLNQRVGVSALRI